MRALFDAASSCPGSGLRLASSRICAVDVRVDSWRWRLSSCTAVVRRRCSCPFNLLCSPYTGHAQLHLARCKLHRFSVVCCFRVICIADFYQIFPFLWYHGSDCGVDNCHTIAIGKMG